VHHAGLALVRLGFRVRVVTRVRTEDADALLAPLRSEGVEVCALPSLRTTTYRNDYAGPVDRHELLEVSDPIHPEDVPAAWRSCELTQLGPLHPQDLLPETAQSFTGLVGIDLQGLLRAPAGQVHAPRSEALRDFTTRAGVVQVSEAELGAGLSHEALALAREQQAKERLAQLSGQAPSAGGEQPAPTSPSTDAATETRTP